MKIPKAVVATTNAHKFREFMQIASNLGWNAELIPLSHFPDAPAVVEDGNTYEENAKKKALEISKFCQVPALAEDSGMEVKALEGFPGVTSRRFFDDIAKQKNCQDYASAQHESNKEILRWLEEKEFEDRDAKYVSVACIAFPDCTFVCARGENRGRIADSERGSSGFGFDPIFLPQEFEYERTFGELGQDLKNTVSHRRRALEALVKKIQVFEPNPVSKP